MKIPYIIHQIWWQGTKCIPEKFKNYRKSWIKNHKHFTFIIWDKNLFEKLLHKINNPIFNTIYNDLPIMIQKIDFCKYVVLYYYGGIYVDMDTISEKSIDKFLNIHDLVVSKLKIYKNLNIYLINNGVIFSKKNNNFFLYLFKEIYINRKKKIYQTQDLYILESTGPIVFTKSIIKYIQEELHSSNDIIILKPKFFESNEIDNTKSKKGLYITHLHDGSWFSTIFKFHFNISKYFNEKKIILLCIFIIFYLL